MAKSYDMENLKSFNFPYKEIEIDLLDPMQQTMVKNANQALTLAHAPYSKFKVGAAILLESGEIVSGNNQENAAYPSGLCAERVALFSAMASGIRLIKKIAVVARDRKGNQADAFCCGACRQVIMEYATVQGLSPIQIIMQTNQNKYIILEDARYLLPFQFDATTLN